MHTSSVTLIATFVELLKLLHHEYAGMKRCSQCFGGITGSVWEGGRGVTMREACRGGTGEGRGGEIVWERGEEGRDVTVREAG